MARILQGIPVRENIAERLAQQVSKLPFVPTLAVIQIGNVSESNAYIEQKKKFAERIGAFVAHIQLSDDVSEEKVIAEIRKLNSDPIVHGIIVQMPIPALLNKTAIIEAIDPAKDVDGLTAYNTKLLWNNEKGFVPATARGILSLLNFYQISVVGKRVVVVGRSILVGKPTAMHLLNHDASVTVCHSKTVDLASATKLADILIVATGHPKLITKDHVTTGQVVIDVGINLSQLKLEDEIQGRKLVGDVDYGAVEPIVSAISPVPGGVGPMTVASLFENLVESAEKVAAARK
jgi:methylenetetrahydrofolate dehydrogenase (NADP+)/methenyltetrahydrofolate cyclohydrolase